MPKPEDLLELSEDPELAFVEFEEQLRAAMNDSIRDMDGWDYIQGQKLYYIFRLMAFHDAHGFSFFEKPKLTRSMGVIDFQRSFDNFLDEVAYWSTQTQVRQAQRLRPISTVLSLTPEMKRQIHHFINRIRAIVEPVDLPVAKKEAIWTELNALADEVDRDRTKAEAMTALAIEIAGATGEAAKRLAPVKEILDAITNLFAKAKEMTEFRRLPSPSGQSVLRAPRKQLPQPQSDQDSQSAGDIQDETPF
jgi:hypothetical protein